MLNTNWISASQKSDRLLIALHGLGDSMEGYRWLPEAMRLPDMNYLLVNAPDEYYGGFSWYDYANDPGPGVRRSRKLLFELLDWQRGRGFPTEKTVLLGFSQGCLMTVDVGARYTHRFAALVGISGYVFEPENILKELSPVAKEQRFLITHGTQDPIVPFDKSEEHFQMLKAGGLNISWHVFNKAHTIAGEAEISMIRNFVAA